MSNLRSTAEIQNDVNIVFAQLGESDYQVRKHERIKDALRARLEQLEQEMGIAQSIAAAQAKSIATQQESPASASSTSAASPAERMSTAAPMPKRSEDIERAIANVPPLFTPDAPPNGAT